MKQLQKYLRAIIPFWTRWKTPGTIEAWTKFARMALHGKIAGSRQAERIAARRSDLAFIALDRIGQLWGSKNAKGFLVVAAECA